MRGHLSADGAEQAGSPFSQSDVPPEEKDDKALGAAAHHLLRGVTVNADAPCAQEGDSEVDQLRGFTASFRPCE